MRLQATGMLKSTTNDSLPLPVIFNYSNIGKLIERHLNTEVNSFNGEHSCEPL
jgi:hypothetical protein